MWVSYHNEHFWTMCENFHGKYKDYHVKYFPFLEEKNIQTRCFLGYSIPRKFVNFTPEEMEELRVYGIIDKINYN